MTSKLDELLIQLSISDLMYSEYDEEIFHYTSPGGFESILFSDKDNITLWGTVLSYESVNTGKRFCESWLYGKFRTFDCKEKRR